MQKLKSDKKLCGAKTRSGGTCKSVAMDNGRCRMHSGRNNDDKRPNLPGRPVEHGIYSKYLKDNLGELAGKFKADPEFLSLQDEIALIKVMLNKYVDSKTHNLETIDEDKISVINGLVEQVRKLNETYIKIEAQRKYALSPDEVVGVVKQVVAIIRKHVYDDVVYNQIRDEVSKIKI